MASPAQQRSVSLECRMAVRAFAAPPTMGLQGLQPRVITLAVIGARRTCRIAESVGSSSCGAAAWTPAERDYPHSSNRRILKAPGARVLLLFEVLRQQGLQHDLITYNAVIAVCGRAEIIG